MAKKQENDDTLQKMLALAPQSVLSSLILKLSAKQPKIRLKCIHFLKSRVKLSETLKSESRGETVLCLWDELQSDLSEFDEYGGGDYETENMVYDLLDDIITQITSREIELSYRMIIREEALNFIRSGNTGMDDALYGLVYATCYDNDDLCDLAESLEFMKKGYSVTHARRIYRKIGNGDKYLELRMQEMAYGGDYYDLATFFWESGQKKKALEVAEDGLQKATGRMDELREFVAILAKESGNHTKYMTLQFEQAADHMTLEKYKAFEKMCSAAEWKQLEPQILSKMKKTWELEQMKIFLHRKEYSEALAILVRDQYPLSSWNINKLSKIATELEEHYPEEILQYYLSGLGNIRKNASRTTYARKADIMAKIRHLLVEVIRDETRWKKLAIAIKRENIKRPAFQDEFAKKLPDWTMFK